MNDVKLIWLAADYHFPATYSCRIPMSSQFSALAMPAPGPATVRLAMVRTGIELFGKNYVQTQLFPAIRSAEIRVKPPAAVAITSQFMQAYKANGNGKLTQSLAYREMCHAQGMMTVSIKVPIDYEDVIRETLAAIGYWGQTSSLTFCMAVKQQPPPLGGEFAKPLKSLQSERPVGQFFSCLVSEFRDTEVQWDEILPNLRKTDTQPLRLDVYIWPLVIEKQHHYGKQLVYRPLN